MWRGEEGEREEEQVKTHMNTYMGLGLGWVGGVERKDGIHFFEGEGEGGEFFFLKNKKTTPCRPGATRLYTWLV
jgi:hypothetical protein